MGACRRVDPSHRRVVDRAATRPSPTTSPVRMAADYLEGAKGSGHSPVCGFQGPAQTAHWSCAEGAKKKDYLKETGGCQRLGKKSPLFPPPKKIFFSFFPTLLAHARKTAHYFAQFFLFSQNKKYYPFTKG